MRQYILCFFFFLLVNEGVYEISSPSINCYAFFLKIQLQMIHTHTLIILNIKKIELLTTYEIISRLYKFAVKFKCNKRNN